VSEREIGRESVCVCMCVWGGMDDCERVYLVGYSIEAEEGAVSSVCV